MLESLIRFSIQQRFVVLLGTLFLLAAGVYSFSQLPIEAFPDVLNTSVQVITLAPGQSSQDVEKKITIPLEREFSGVPKLESIRSISEFGLSVVYLTFSDGADKYWARAQAMEKISTASLPPGVSPSLAPLASVTGEVLRYEVKGSGLTTTELRTIQDWILEKQFRSIPGVADVVGYGGKVRAWDVLVDPGRLAAYNLSVRQVADAITNGNLNAGGNLMDWPTQTFVVRSVGQYESKEDIESVGITQRGNGIIRVRDIGRVVESFLTPRGVVGRDKHDDIVQGIVLLRKGENPVLVGRALKQKVEQLRSSTLLPEGVHLQVYYDRLNLVDKTTHTVGHNLLEGFILVVLILYIFLRNLRATGLVAAVVPLSLCFAFLMILLTGTPANLISLGAIDFGIIVDGAVIITEFVLSYFENKKLETEEALQHELSKIEKIIITVIKPVFVSMILIIVAYLPIFSLQSVEGKTFTPLAWTISFALLGALLMSLTIVPALMPKMIALTIREHWNLHSDAPRKKKTYHLPGFTKITPFAAKLGKPFRKFSIDELRKSYLSTLQTLIKKPKRIFYLLIAITAIGAISFVLSGSEFLPELDEGALWIRATFPHSMNISEGKKLSAKIRAIIGSYDETRTVVSQLGGPEDGSDPNLFDNAEFFVDLKAKETWKRFDHEREELIGALRKDLTHIPGVDFNISQPIADNVEEAISGVKGKNAVKIYGPDLVSLDQIATQIQAMLKSVQGITDVGVVAAMPMVPQLTIQVDRVKVAQAGLTLQDVNDLVEIAVGGKSVTQVYDQEARLDVVVRADSRFRSNIEAIRSLPVPLPSGGRMRLEQLASIHLVNSPQALYRESGYRRIGVKFNVEGRDLGGAMVEILAKAKNLKIPSGYFLIWGGEYENQKRAMNRLMVVIPLTLILLTVILFMLFEDFGVASIVLCCLILSTSGSMALLLLRGIPFSVSASVGLLALFGVVALQGISMTSAFLRSRQEGGGRDIMQLMIHVAQENFRPILMTTLLAALGLLPTAVSHGMGSETQRPLATAVIGGLLTGTINILIILPVALYFLFEWRRKKAPEHLDEIL